MENRNEQLAQLLKNFVQILGPNINSAFIYDRQGLMMAEQLGITGEGEIGEKTGDIFGAVASVAERALSRISKETAGTFGTGYFDTDLFRIVLTEAGKYAVFLCVFDYDTNIDSQMPYLYLVSEKIASILEQSPNLADVDISIPNLQIGIEFPALTPPAYENPSMFQFRESVEVSEMHFKLIVLGDPAVGKTSLINSFAQHRFNADYRPTLGISITNQEYYIQGFEDKLIRFMVWDLAGQKFFQRVRSYYYNESNAAFVIYDISRPETFNPGIRTWVGDLRKKIPDIPIVILGNKIDLIEERKVSTSEGEKLAKELRCSYLETSAKSGENVRDAFSIVGIGLFFKSKN